MMAAKSSNASIKPEQRVSDWLTVVVSVPSGELSFCVGQVEYLFELGEVDSERVTH